MGAGNIRPGIVTETTGGVMAIFATLEQPVLDPQGKVPLYYHATAREMRPAALWTDGRDGIKVAARPLF